MILKCGLGLHGEEVIAVNPDLPHYFCWLLVVTGMDPHSNRMYLCTYPYLYKDKNPLPS